MKFKTQIATATSLLLAATVASGHSGHEALGDGVHMEYLFAIGAACIVAIYALIQHKRDRQD
ncbi:hypothetical protein [Marinobacter caseinilyticus]|uniref:hypothetical protein n=1 Tax=Marinobacter caseinilyticus TaxID=2692195 RepID=UPI00140DFE3C|nr:hypothetical protein [Marinobacter caseinilyticus]